MAVLTPALARLRSDFNAAYPGRDKSSDGWIGDRAHAEETSGHNPDESGRPEYYDSDTVDEVRAVDIDDDLPGDPGEMQRVIDRIIQNPADRARIKYVIYNGRIASRKAGWFKADGSINWRTYTGSNKHDKHAHFSGDPANDNDNREWTSVRLPQKEALVSVDTQRDINTNQSLFALVRMQELAEGMTVVGYSDANGRMEMPVVTFLKGVGQTVDATQRAVNQMPTRVEMQQYASDAVVSALQNPAVVDLLATAIASKLQQA